MLAIKTGSNYAVEEVLNIIVNEKRVDEIFWDRSLPRYIVLIES